MNVRSDRYTPPALNNIFWANKSIKQIQFIQADKFKMEIKIVKSDLYDNNDIIDLNKKLKMVFGNDMKIQILYVDKIEKELSGKYRLTKCLFDL